MTARHDNMLDQLGGEGDPALARAVADMKQVFASTPPQAPRDAMDRTVYARMAAPARLTPPRPRRLPSRAIRGFGSLAAALVLVSGGVASYLRFTAPVPVSAQTVLRRAAAAQLGPDQAVHYTFAVAVNPAPAKAGQGGTFSTDVWLQTGADGAPAQSAQSLAAGGDTMPGRYVQIGRQVYAYDPGHQAILVAPEAREQPSWLLPDEVLGGASTARALDALAQQAGQRAQLLAPATLDGHAVDVLRVTGWPNRPGLTTTFYFDAQSYLLRGFDAAGNDPSYPIASWQARLTGYQVMAASAAPAGAFILDAPATARIAFRAPDLNTFAAACHASGSIKALLASGATPLAACQETAPGMTAATLVAALFAPNRLALDTAAASGQITAAQETTGLANQQAWLMQWVTSPAGQNQ